MKAPETQSNLQPALESTASSTRHRPYRQVFDGRKQRVRGLWERDGTFYARFTATDQAGRKRDVFRALPEASTVPAAKAALQKLRDEASQTVIPVDGRCPSFADYARRYLAEVSIAKRPATKRKEETQLGWWIERIGALTLRQIHRTHVNSGLADLAKAGLSPRTSNIYVIALRSVLKRAAEEGLIRELPTRGLRPLKVTQRKRQLVPPETFERMLGAATGATKNARQFEDYFRLLLLTGAREKEALRIRWVDVDFDGRQLTVGADGLSKNGESRQVDFSAPLESLLRSMHARRAPESQWLFPSPQRGDADTHSETFRESLRLCCDAAGIPRIGFHDARHAFISRCVMAGVDFMTIARWVGHKDGGVLIGKVYGHIANEHRRKMADRLTLHDEPANIIRIEGDTAA